MIGSRFLGPCFLAAGAFVLAGCLGGSSGDPAVAPTTGTVTYKGQPVAGASVSFIKEGAPRSGVGITNADGKFQISTFANNDGALIGDNVVTVTKKSANAPTIEPYVPATSVEEMTKRMREMSQKKPSTEKTDEIPAKYGNPQVSGLKAIVSSDSSKNDFKFELVD